MRQRQLTFALVTPAPWEEEDTTTQSQPTDREATEDAPHPEDGDCFTYPRNFYQGAQSNARTQEKMWLRSLEKAKGNEEEARVLFTKRMESSRKRLERKSRQRVIGLFATPHSPPSPAQ